MATPMSAFKPRARRMDNDAGAPVNMSLELTERGERYDDAQASRLWESICMPMGR